MDEALLNGLRDAIGLSLLVYVRELLRSMIIQSSWYTVQDDTCYIVQLNHGSIGR
jgi:hypothetical protein